MALQCVENLSRTITIKEVIPFIIFFTFLIICFIATYFKKVRKWMENTHDLFIKQDEIETIKQGTCVKCGKELSKESINYCKKHWKEYKKEEEIEDDGDEKK